MNLETWLKQSRPQGEQLGVIEALCTALNEAHLRGVVHPAIEPSNIDLASDGSVSLAEAVHGVSSASGSRYRAPEVAEGSPHSAPADIYAAGVIFYEMLAGRPPAVGADRVTPLGDTRPDLSRDLTDAVMGCLERGPDWRPRDLGYLLQVVAQVRGSAPSRAQVARPVRTETARSAPAPSSRPTTRASNRSRKDNDLPLSAARDTGGRSSLPMILVAIVVLAGGGVGAWVWLQSQGQTPRATPSARASVTPPPVPAATAQPASSPTPMAVAAQQQTPQVPPPIPTPSAPLATPFPTSVTPTPVAAPTLVPVPIATPPPSRVPTPTPTPTLTPTPTPPTTGAQPPVAAPAIDPPMLTAVTPLSLKRGAQAMIDIRGMALRSDQQIRITHMKERGVSVPIRRVKWVDATLMKALVDMDPNLPTGQYAVAVLDPQGGVTNALVITITK